MAKLESGLDSESGIVAHKWLQMIINKSDSHKWLQIKGILISNYK